MRTIKSPRRFRALVAAAFVFALPVATVEAHTTLKSATPGKGKTVRSKVKEVKATFGASLTSGTLEIANETGHIIVLKSNGVTKSNKRVLRAVLRSPIATGRYTVSWRVKAADGHTQRGSWKFRVVD